MISAEEIESSSVDFNWHFKLAIYQQSETTHSTLNY